MRNDFREPAPPGELQELDDGAPITLPRADDVFRDSAPRVLLIGTLADALNVEAMERAVKACWALLAVNCSAHPDDAARAAHGCVKQRGPSKFLVAGLHGGSQETKPMLMQS